MKRSQEADKPFFVWLNTCRMHMYTRLSDEYRYLPNPTPPSPTSTAAV